MMIHGYGAAAILKDGQVCYSGYLCRLEQAHAWARKVGATHLSVWRLLPSTPAEREVAVRFGMKPTHYWEDHPLFECEDMPKWEPETVITNQRVPQ